MEIIIIAILAVSNILTFIGFMTKYTKAKEYDEIKPYYDILKKRHINNKRLQRGYYKRRQLRDNEDKSPEIE